MKPPSVRWMVLPLVLAGIVSIGILVFSEISHNRLLQAGQVMARSMELQEVTREVMSLVVDAETGQRGYLLTGRNEYLEPYSLAVKQLEERFDRLRALVRSSTEEQGKRANRINNLIGQKLAEIEVSLRLYREQGPEAAQRLMETDIGKKSMDALRAEVEALNSTEQAYSAAAWTLWEQDTQYSRFGMALISLFNLFLLLIVYLLATREMRLRETARRELEAYKDHLESEVQARTEELSRAYQHLQAVQETEKSKLARDIHDELGSILVSAKMDTSWVTNRLKASDPAATAKLQRALTTLDEGVMIKRRLIEELRPTLLDNLGLGAAIEWQATDVCARANLECKLSLPDEEPQLPSEVAIALFRVVQESLTNITRYAQAKTVWIDLLKTDAGIHLVVRDDGIGLPQATAGTSLSHGILGMRERITALGGSFKITGSPGQGTIVEVDVPCAIEAVAPDGSDDPEPASHGER